MTSVASSTSDLLTHSAPLFGRAASVIVPSPFAGADLARLWGFCDPLTALWIDAAVGGMPGYRPLLDVPRPGDTGREAWMVEEVLAASSPLLDAAEAALTESLDVSNRGIYRAILDAIAAGERTFSAIARVAGMPTGALSRPLAALERAGLVLRVPDPLRSRRDTYDLADPHLRAWLRIIAPNRSQLQAGRSGDVWARVRETTWRSQVLGPRWEAVVREHLARMPGVPSGPIEVVGSTTVSDRTTKSSHEIDMVAVREKRVVALGEAKLRRLGVADLARLRRVRDLVGAPEAVIVLASSEGIDPDAVLASDVVTISPADVYG